MKSVHYKDTLFYYDGPQVFEARDAIGGHYAAVAVGPDARPLSEPPPSEGHERYLVVGVAPEQLRLFRGGEIDLHSLLAGSEEDERYTATTSVGLDGPLQLERLTGSLLDSGMLPDLGFLLHDRPSDGGRDRNRRKGKHGMNRQLTAIVEREGGGYVALCPEVDVASQGDTVAEARDNLAEALTLFFETASAEEVDKRLRSEVYVTHVEVAVGQAAHSVRPQQVRRILASHGFRPTRRK